MEYYNIAEMGMEREKCEYAVEIVIFIRMKKAYSNNKMNVSRRTCGYLGENFWDAVKTKEIIARVLHG